MKIAFADLTHTGYGISSQTFPLGAGMLAAQLKDKHDVEVFKYPEDFSRKLEQHVPDMVCFTNYAWNNNINKEYAKRIKDKAPNIKILFGGPNTIENKPNYIDEYIPGEGEQVIKDYIENKPINNNRIKNLKELKSPYLTGIMDKFFDGKLMPLIESMRGCPFECTFCNTGNKYYNELHRFPIERTKKELEYIIEKTNVPNLCITDSNFGMFDEDIEIAKMIKESRNKKDYPKYLDVSTGKKINKISKVVNILGGNMGFNVSSQSTDKEVTDSIKRYNIPLEKMKELAYIGKKLGANPCGETILALPNDTRDKYFKTVSDMLDTGVNMVRCFHLIMSPGAEVSSKESREKYKLKTKYRNMARTFGTYKLFGKEFSVFEKEEICTGNDKMNFDDYIDGRMLGLTVETFYNNGILEELITHLNNNNIKTSSLIKEIHNNINKNNKLSFIYNKFKKNIIEDIESSEVMKKGNVLYECRADIVFNHMPELHDIAFNSAKKLLHDDKIDKIHSHSLAKKINLLDTEGTYKCDNISYKHTHEQKKLLNDYINQYGSNLDGLGFILHKTFANNLYRKCTKN